LGVVSYDRLQYFLLALLLKEIKPETQNMPEVVSKQTRKIIEHMKGDFINQRMFREYLQS
jgi:hypothetical protein